MRITNTLLLICLLVYILMSINNEGFKHGDFNDLKKNPMKANQWCEKLTKHNCMEVPLCGYLNDNKCVHGNRFGPTFLSENGGKTKIHVARWQFNS